MLVFEFCCDRRRKKGMREEWAKNALFAFIFKEILVVNLFHISECKGKTQLFPVHKLLVLLAVKNEPIGNVAPIRCSFAIPSYGVNIVTCH